jgi:ABC-2 type transport system ATP-binding protein
MNSYVISVNGAEKRYESFQLGPIELDVEPGLIVALVGSNGSGKTTLFQMMMNTVLPDRGTIEVFGKRYEDFEVDVKRRIGYVPESSYSEEAGWRVRELVAFHSRWFPTWNQAKWVSLAERFEIDPKTNVKVLSKGMKRRLLFSLALAQEPDLLLLDEPSSGLDPYAWRIMLEEIGQYMAAGNRSVIMATHTIEEVRRLADYVAIIHKGQLLEYTDKDSLVDSWKTFWVGQPLPEPELLPGIVEWEEGPLMRITTNQAQQAEQALLEAGIAIVKRQQVELDEVLHHVIAAQRKQPNGKGAIRV